MQSQPLTTNRGSESESIVAAIGHTPLVRLSTIDRDLAGISIYAKAEWLNPGGSVKDRAALSMIRDAEADGRLSASKTILDATSGNTGIALAMIGAALGYRVSLTVPANASAQRIHLLRVYGAEIVLTDAAFGTDGAILRAREMAKAEPHRFVYLDQYSNHANWRAHYHGTAEEIWEQTAGCITHFVAALGTSGTFTGTTRRLRELNPLTRCVDVQPEGPFHGLEGMKHMATAMVPSIYDATLADDHATVNTEEAYDAVRRLARDEGLAVGVSSGAALVACLRVARAIPEHRSAMIVTVFPDAADRYADDRFWDAPSFDVHTTQGESQ